LSEGIPSALEQENASKILNLKHPFIKMAAHAKSRGATYGQRASQTFATEKSAAEKTKGRATTLGSIESKEASRRRTGEERIFAQKNEIIFIHGFMNDIHCLKTLELAKRCAISCFFLPAKSRSGSLV